MCTIRTLSLLLVRNRANRPYLVLTTARLTDKTDLVNNKIALTIGSVCMQEKTALDIFSTQLCVSLQDIVTAAAF